MLLDSNSVPDSKFLTNFCSNKEENIYPLILMTVLGIQQFNLFTPTDLFGMF